MKNFETVLDWKRSGFTLKIAVFICLLSVIGIGAISTDSHAAAAPAQVTFNVNSFEDIRDANLGDGICAASDGRCTLRAAIQESNESTSATTINLEVGTYTVIGTLRISKDVKIVGAGKSETILSSVMDNGLYINNSFELLVCDQENHSVIGYDRDGNVNGYFVSPGQDGLKFPVSLDTYDRNVYVTTMQNGVFDYKANGQYRGLLIEPSDIGQGSLLSDGVVGIGNGDFYLADASVNNRLLKFDSTSGSLLGELGPNDVVLGNVLTDQRMGRPDSIAFYGGDVFVSDPLKFRVLRFSGTTSSFIEIFLEESKGDLDQINQPRGLIFRNGDLYIADEGTDSVLKFDADTGAFEEKFVAEGAGGLDRPTEMDFGPDGHLYVVSNETNQILRYNGSTGEFIDVFVEPDDTYLENPSCIKWRRGAGVTGPNVTLEGFTIRGATSSGVLIDGGATVVMDQISVEDNNERGYEGEAGIVNHGNLYMVDTDVVRNSSLLELDGAGIINYGFMAANRTLIAENKAGGGIQNIDGIVELTNSTVSSNESNGAGGGILNVGPRAELRINHSTIVLNSATSELSIGSDNGSGGGIHMESGAKTIMANSILANNSDGLSSSARNHSPDCYNLTPENFVSRGRNLIGVVKNNCRLSQHLTDMIGNENSPLDPMLDRLANRSHMPLSGSPAIDAGQDTAFGLVAFTGDLILERPFSYDCISRDQAFSIRPVDGDGNGKSRCDLGAVEVAAPAVATPTSTVVVPPPIIPTVMPSPTAVQPPIGPTATATPSPTEPPSSTPDPESTSTPDVPAATATAEASMTPAPSQSGENLIYLPFVGR